MPKKILILNGPNLNLTGQRQTTIYGNESLEQMNQQILDKCKSYDMLACFYQSNHEGAIIDKIHEAMHIVDGIIINAGAFTHYSYAIADAIACCGLPTIEVHLSNIYAREIFRTNSVLAAVCCGTITGFGKNSYLLAVEALMPYIKGECI